MSEPCAVVECDQLAESPLCIVGCVHEHLRNRRYCPECYADLIQGFVYCWTCDTADAPYAHSCEVRYVGVVPDGAPH